MEVRRRDGTATPEGLLPRPARHLRPLARGQGSCGRLDALGDARRGSRVCPGQEGLDRVMRSQSGARPPGTAPFFLSLKELFCGCFARSNLYSAKEKLKIVSVRGGAAHFCPAAPEPREARRGNAVRAIFKIHRQKGF